MSKIVSLHATVASTTSDYSGDGLIPPSAKPIEISEDNKTIYSLCQELLEYPKIQYTKYHRFVYPSKYTNSTPYFVYKNLGFSSYGHIYIAPKGKKLSISYRGEDLSYFYFKFIQCTPFELYNSDVPDKYVEEIKDILILLLKLEERELAIVKIDRDTHDAVKAINDEHDKKKKIDSAFSNISGIKKELEELLKVD